MFCEVSSVNGAKETYLIGDNTSNLVDKLGQMLVHKCPMCFQQFSQASERIYPKVEQILRGFKTKGIPFLTEGL